MQDVTDRVALPGLALAITGALSLLFGLVSIGLQLAALLPGLMVVDGGEVPGFLMTSLMRQAPGLLYAVVTMIASLLTLIAGMRLRSVQSPTLIHIGAVLAMVPCCSPCCFLGVFTGGWALWSIQDDEVRAALADA